MTHRFVPTTALFVLAAFSTSVPAQTVLQTDALEQGQAAFQDDTQLAEAPGRAGRISLVQGKVDIGGDVLRDAAARDVRRVGRQPDQGRGLLVGGPALRRVGGGAARGKAQVGVHRGAGR